MSAAQIGVAALVPPLGEDWVRGNVGDPATAEGVELLQHRVGRVDRHSEVTQVWFPIITRSLRGRAVRR